MQSHSSPPCGLVEQGAVVTQGLTCAAQVVVGLAVVLFEPLVKITDCSGDIII